MNEIISIEEKLLSINPDSTEDVRIMVSIFLKKKKNYLIFIRLFLSCCIALPEKIEFLCSFLSNVLNFNCIEDRETFFSLFISQVKNRSYKSREINFAANYLINQQQIPPEVIAEIKPFVIVKTEDFLAIDGERIQTDEKFNENQLKKGRSPSLIVKYIREDDLDSLLTFISSHNESDFINFVIEKNPFERCEVIVDKKCTILDCAAFFGSIKCFKYLVSNQAVITETTFSYAVMGGSAEIIHLIENTLNNIERTIKNDSIYIFTCSIKYHRSEIFEWLLDHVRPIDIEKIQYLILICASYSNYAILCNYLIASMEFSCLNTMYNDEKIFDWIVTDYLFNFKRRNLSEQQILSKFKVVISQLFFSAVHQKQLDCLKVIVKNSPFIGQLMNSQFIEIIFKEFENENEDVIDYLLNCGKFDLNLKCRLKRPDHFSHLKYNNQTKSLLMWSCDSNFEKLIEKLIGINSIDINSKCFEDVDFGTRNVFDSVCENCSKSLLNQFLIQFPEKVEFNLPLHFSCRGEKLDNFEFFLSKINFDVNKADNKKRTCLHYACQTNRVTFLEKLLSFESIKIDLKNDEKDTAYFTALKSNSIECIQYFLKKSLIDINECDFQNNDTSLHLATKLNSIEIIKLILPNQNLDINKQNKNGIFIYIL